MEDRRVETIMYMRFNNQDKRGALMKANKKGIVIVDKPFKEVLVEASIEKGAIEEVVPIVEHAEELEINLLWQDAIHANYLRTRGGK